MIQSSRSATALPPGGTDPDRKHQQHGAHSRDRAAANREEITGQRARPGLTAGRVTGAAGTGLAAATGTGRHRQRQRRRARPRNLGRPDGTRSPPHTAASRPAAPPRAPRPHTPEARRVLQALLEVHGHLHAARRRGCAAECGASPRRGRRPGGAGRGWATRGRCRQRHSWRCAGARRREAAAARTPQREPLSPPPAPGRN